jgi:hypothetical protein
MAGEARRAASRYPPQSISDLEYGRRFSRAGQDSLAGLFQPAQFLGFLLHALFVHGGPVLEHVGAHPE